MNEDPNRYPMTSEPFEPGTGSQRRWVAPDVLYELRALQLDPYGNFLLVGSYLDVYGLDTPPAQYLTYSIELMDVDGSSFTVDGPDLFAGFIKIGPTCLAVVVKPVVRKPSSTTTAVHLETYDPAKGKLAALKDGQLFGGVTIGEVTYVVYTTKCTTAS